MKESSRNRKFGNTKKSQFACPLRKVRPHKARQKKPRAERGKTGQDRTRPRDKKRQDATRQDTTRRGKTRRRKTKQDLQTQDWARQTNTRHGLHSPASLVFLAFFLKGGGLNNQVKGTCISSCKCSLCPPMGSYQL